MNRAIAAALLIAACGGTEPPAAIEPLPVPALPLRLTLPASDAIFAPADPAVSANGAGSSLVGAFSFEQSAGTIEMSGRPVPAIIYARSEFPGSYVLHQAYALADDRFYLLWLYCDSGAVSLVYVEDSLGSGGRFDGATGSCDEIVRTSISTVHFPEAVMDWPQVGGGVQVEGSGLQLPPNGAGAALYNGSVQAALPFARVDCTACGRPGWRELHSMLWNPYDGGTTVGIFYLLEADHGHVLFEYGLDLRRMKRAMPGYWPAPWTPI